MSTDGTPEGEVEHGRDLIPMDFFIGLVVLLGGIISLGVEHPAFPFPLWASAVVILLGGIHTGLTWVTYRE